MAVDLDVPLSWTTATGDAAVMLDELQPDILKAHVREFLSVLFLHFADQADGRSFLGALVPLMKSAKTHLEEITAFKTTGVAGSPYVGVGLTHAGYGALGIADANTPDDSSFARGMTDPDSRQTLSDPPPSVWEPLYRQATPEAAIHAVVMIGDVRDAPVSALREEILALLPDTATVLGEETGLAQRNAQGEGIEHFGYIDGRSQPLFLTEDITDEREGTDGTNAWDTSAPLKQVLVADRAAPDPTRHFGSYFIFRKLEQNVRRFVQAEEDLADALGLTGADRARAGAMLVGRFRDGTPLTLQRADGADQPVMNNFSYDSDPHGAKCPFHGHIRKTNPRGSGGFEPPADERKHLMVRRGIPFGERTDVPFDTSVPIAQRPTGGVGLLFMAFNSLIASQFDFTQQAWANNPGFPSVPAGTPPPGLDPVIGQGARPAQTYPLHWAGTSTEEVPAVPQSVRMKGGEYFFMPSLAFLRSL
ncbi:MAG: Dyp-type peroxidase [Pseudonocardiaceae bacterium]